MGMIVLALLADSVEIAKDPDEAWGVASREILGGLEQPFHQHEDLLRGHAARRYAHASRFGYGHYSDLVFLQKVVREFLGIQSFYLDETEEPGKAFQGRRHDPGTARQRR